MSLNVPSFRFLLGIDTNRPLGPWMTLMSVTTKQWSKTIDTNALSFSSSTGMTLTSVISMLPAPSRPSTAPSANPPPVPGGPVLVERQGPRRVGPKALLGESPLRPPCRPRCIEQPEVACATAREGGEPRTAAHEHAADARGLLAKVRRLLEGSRL